ncbi:biotin-dependent carboxyltransferase family protein [Amorphoplanes nipponensis]|uniref:Allophanate hydrolase n=1 Tax=Actinoplanes nipponensis TaxID=135950 RepID=A0A919JBF5_9ACTN|nr:biotin-dependent carboxyltransferase family protein [Actinoplanes nipponensis]GIE47608.1 allophanate hydrolase [Actinoplanes nipponensis]
MTMTVLRAGPLTVFKDEGRPGHAGQGVAPSGAVDRAAYARANTLAGNPRGAAALECTLGGLRVRFEEPATVVLTGTDAVLTVDGARTGVEEVVAVPAGAVVAVTMPRRGLRSYLAVRGGFAVPLVLGSRSTDLFAGIGPARPAPGDSVPIGPAPAESARGLPPAGEPATDAPLEVDLGPRADWFTAAAIETFLSAEFTVSPAGDSVGLRLDGPVLARARTDELLSEGMVRGSVQVPPDGHPIIFQADHPVTGGYPVIAVLTPAAADRAGQARPGARIRFARAADPLPGQE